MILEDKYHHAILVLQAISQHKGDNKFFGYVNEWTQANAFCDCREAARRCLVKLGESTKLVHNKKERNGYPIIKCP